MMLESIIEFSNMPDDSEQVSIQLEVKAMLYGSRQRSKPMKNLNTNKHIYK